MAVKIGKLWTNVKFSNLSNNSKLFYIYLATSPDINSVGTTSLDIKVVSLQIDLTIEQLRESMLELVNSEFILCDNVGGVVYFTVLRHFNTLPKSDTTVMKVTRDLASLPPKLVKKLATYGITTDRKAVHFDEPSVEEVAEYALSQGHNIDGRSVRDFYRGQARVRGKQGVWLDSRGKQVKDWRAKLRQVWFKDENRLKTVKGAPKGFEFFHISVDGIMVFPDAWKNGKPFSKNIAMDKKLKQAYEERRGNS